MNKVLVTGGAGFLGTHLVDELVKHSEVVVIDKLSSGNVNKDAIWYNKDIRSSDIQGIFEKERPSVVFHLAAQPIMQKAYDNPRETLDINIMGTVNVLEACRLQGNLESVIVLSSDKCYGKSETLPYTEETPLRGSHPYEVSKTATDLIARTYHKTYNLPIVVPRFVNIFGPGDLNLDRLIPAIFNSIINKKELLVRGGGTMVREYIYVKDAVKGCIKLAENIEDVKGEAFNFGSGNIFSILEIIQKIEETLGVKIPHKVEEDTHMNEVSKQYSSWEKVKERLGWEPEYNFEQGIVESFEWYKDKL